MPLGGTFITQEINAIRYELVVRVKTHKVWLVLRAYDDPDATLGLSIRYTAP